MTPPTKELSADANAPLHQVALLVSHSWERWPVFMGTNNEIPLLDQALH